MSELSGFLWRGGGGLPFQVPPFLPWHVQFQLLLPLPPISCQKSCININLPFNCIFLSPLLSGLHFSTSSSYPASSSMFNWKENFSLAAYFPSRTYPRSSTSPGKSFSLPFPFSILPSLLRSYRNSLLPFPLSNLCHIFFHILVYNNIL